MIYASFQIADAVMLVLGLRMLHGLKDLKKMAPAEAISFSATIVMTVFTQNMPMERQQAAWCSDL